jgi:hypothetical protein
LATEKYKPVEIIDWYLKLARIAEGYTSFEHPRVSPVEREDRNDYLRSSAMTPSESLISPQAKSSTASWN